VENIISVQKYSNQIKYPIIVENTTNGEKNSDQC